MIGRPGPWMMNDGYFEAHRDKPDDDNDYAATIKFWKEKEQFHWVVWGPTGPSGELTRDGFADSMSEAKTDADVSLIQIGYTL